MGLGFHQTQGNSQAPKMVVKPRQNRFHEFRDRLECWRRRRIDPVTEVSLTHSNSSRTNTCAGFVPT